MRLSLIAAMARNRVIGQGGRIPWRIKGEQKRFKELTLGHPVIMGRKTHESIGRPLPGRTNIVISRREGYEAPGCKVARSLDDALLLCEGAEEVFVAGGGEIYREALPRADRIYLTLIPRDIPGDVFFPPFTEEEFTVTASEEVTDPEPYTCVVYDRRFK